MKYITTIAAFLLTLAMSHAQSLDGIYDANDNYSQTKTVTWYNSDSSTSRYGDPTASDYGDPGNEAFETTIRYGNADGSYWLFVEVPIYAKNMIWGIGLTEADWLTYRDSGKPLDFKAATQSEQLIFRTGTDYNSAGVATADLSLVDGATDLSAVSGLIGFKDSLDYLFDNSLATLESSINRDVTMSFEFQFDNAAAMNQLVAYAENGLDFHLSPERMDVIPEPSSSLLFALAGIIFGMRRRR